MRFAPCAGSIALLGLPPPANANLRCGSPRQASSARRRRHRRLGSRGAGHAAGARRVLHAL